ncbi:magnesium/cobalt efflux protein [Siphonobacter sp. SORGH_AS_0500]|nr:gliding motility-associated protein GldE [Siphonobacter sp. SORGH_AS_0500]PKK35765.1 magnesium/cobalt efflux protein [Siphonobacter sp. SORGH_AS_0500]
MLDPFPLWAPLANAVGAGFYISNGLILILLLAASALASGSEVGFFSLSLDARNDIRDSDHASERRIAKLLDHPQLLLATILIFKNLLDITLVTLTAVATKEALGEGVEAWVSILIQTVGVTFLIVFFGELIPKVWANQNPIKFLKITAPVIEAAQVIFKPISIPLMSISNMIEKRVQRKGYTITAEELSHALEITTGKDTSLEQKEILRGIVNFSSISARQIMRSRMDITAFDIELDFHELMDKINKSGYSRVPVYRGSIDKIEGILYIKDLLPYIDQDESFNWQETLRPVYFIPESKKIDDLLHDFQEKRVHVAIIVNEYGETEGLITLEDIIEEIVGDIRDEYDEEEIQYTKIDDNTYVFEGKTSLNDVTKVLSMDSEIFDTVRGDSESLGGLLLELFGRLPKVNEEVMHQYFTFRVLAADQKRIKKVRVSVLRPGAEVTKAE